MKKNGRKRRKRALLRLQYVLTGAAMVCVAVIALFLVYTLGDNEISGPGGNAGTALLGLRGKCVCGAGEEAHSGRFRYLPKMRQQDRKKMETTKCQTM